MKYLALLFVPFVVACTTTTTKPDGTVVVTGPDGKTIAVLAGTINQVANDVIILQQTKMQLAHPPLPTPSK